MIKSVYGTPQEDSPINYLAWAFVVILLILACVAIKVYRKRQADKRDIFGHELPKRYVMLDSNTASFTNLAHTQKGPNEFFI